MNYGCKPNIRTESIALRIQIGIRVDTGSKKKKIKKESFIFYDSFSRIIAKIQGSPSLLRVKILANFKLQLGREISWTIFRSQLTDIQTN